MREVRVRAGRECVTSPVRVVWVWVWAAECAVGVRHIKGRAQCKAAAVAPNAAWCVFTGVWVQYLLYTYALSPTRRLLT